MEILEGILAAFGAMVLLCWFIYVIDRWATPLNEGPRAGENIEAGSLIYRHSNGKWYRLK